MTAWVRPPRLRSTEVEEGERRATWLELFFDLVFVVAILLGLLAVLVAAEGTFVRSEAR